VIVSLLKFDNGPISDSRSETAKIIILTTSCGRNKSTACTILNVIF
jgi:hypothetical protein